MYKSFSDSNLRYPKNSNYRVSSAHTSKEENQLLFSSPEKFSINDKKLFSTVRNLLFNKKQC